MAYNNIHVTKFNNIKDFKCPINKNLIILSISIQNKCYTKASMYQLVTLNRPFSIPDNEWTNGYTIILLLFLYLLPGFSNELEFMKLREYTVEFPHMVIINAFLSGLVCVKKLMKLLLNPFISHTVNTWGKKKGGQLLPFFNIFTQNKTLKI